MIAAYLLVVVIGTSSVFWDGNTKTITSTTITTEVKFNSEARCNLAIKEIGKIKTPDLISVECKKL